MAIQPLLKIQGSSTRVVDLHGGRQRGLSWSITRPASRPLLMRRTTCERRDEGRLLDRGKDVEVGIKSSTCSYSTALTLGLGSGRACAGSSLSRSDNCPPTTPLWSFFWDKVSIHSARLRSIAIKYVLLINVQWMLSPSAWARTDVCSVVWVLTSVAQRKTVKSEWRLFERPAPRQTPYLDTMSSLSLCRLPGDDIAWLVCLLLQRRGKTTV